MSVQVQIPSQLRNFTGGASQVALEAVHLAGLIEALEARHAGIKDRLLEPTGELRKFVRVFVNEEDVRFLEDIRTPLKAGDTVAIVPAIAGG